jgi:hypothetical protein
MRLPEIERSKKKGKTVLGMRNALLRRWHKWVPVERYSLPDGEHGQFYGPRGTGCAEYGQVRTEAEIDESRLWHGESSLELAEKAGYMDDLLPANVRRELGRHGKAGKAIKTYRDLHEAWSGGIDPDDPEWEPLFDAMNSWGETSYFRVFQEKAAEYLRSLGYAGAHWEYEDEVSREQYQVWDRSAIRRAEVPGKDVNFVVKGGLTAATHRGRDIEFKEVAM